MFGNAENAFHEVIRLCEKAMTNSPFPRAMLVFHHQR